MIGIGEIDLIRQHVDLTLLGVPQKTLTNILGPPGGGVLQTIAISIKGHIDHIRGIPLSASPVKEALTKTMGKNPSCPNEADTHKTFQKQMISSIN
ncbi:MAG: hypothetical protein KKC20_02235 [Proteobacteria bacterium]|nr:hypothetical protein [Pseudomonadota bacterium]